MDEDVVTVVLYIANFVGKMVIMLILVLPYLDAIKVPSADANFAHAFQAQCHVTSSAPD